MQAAAAVNKLVELFGVERRKHVIKIYLEWLYYYYYTGFMNDFK